MTLFSDGFLEQNKSAIVRLMDVEIAPIEHFLNGGVVIDGGANVGLWSCALTLYAGNQVGELHLFEPLPVARDKIASLFESEALSTLDKPPIVHPWALSESVGRATLSFNSEASPLATLSGTSVRLPRRDVQLDNSIEIQTVTIDAFCTRNRINKIDFLKLDVEGHEMEALQGAHGMLSSKSIDALCFEFGLCHIGTNFFRPFWDYLTSFDYKIGLLKRGERGFDILPMPEYTTRWEKFEINRIFVACKDELSLVPA